MADQNACYMGRWHTDSGCFTALVLRGRKRLHLVTVGYPVTVAHQNLTEEQHIEALPYLGVARCARTLRKLARSNGITASAKRVLDRVQQATP